MDSASAFANRDDSRAGHSESVGDVSPPEDVGYLNKIRAKVKWEMKTIVGSSCAFTIFFILLIASLYGVCAGWVCLLPLMAYSFTKSMACAVSLYMKWSFSNKEDLKDLLESVFLVLYYIGIAVKIEAPHVDCVYLIAPVTLTIISRIVVSMGIYGEFQGIYQIVFFCKTTLRFILLLMTCTITFKIQDYFYLSWNQAMWPYWLLFAGLLFMSLASVIIALNACFCQNGDRIPDINDIMVGIWLCYTFVGFTAASFSLVFLIVLNIETEPREISSAFFIFCVYFVVLAFFSATIFSKVVKFGVKVYGTHFTSEAVRSINRSMSRDLSAPQGENSHPPDEVLTTELVHRAFPSILIRLTNTLFRIVDRNEVTNITHGTGQSPCNNNYIETNANNKKNVDLSGIQLQIPKRQGPELLTERMEENGIQRKAVRTEQDIEKIKKADIKMENAGNKGPIDTTCFVCCNAVANAVVLPCCHGGICYECCMKISKQGAKCVYCRQSFWQILKLELTDESKIRDFFRVERIQNVAPYPSLTPSIRSILQQTT